MLLQVCVPGLLHRHHAIAEGLFTPPQDLIRDQIVTSEGVPQEILLNFMLLTQETKHYY